MGKDLVMAALSGGEPTTGKSYEDSTELKDKIGSIQPLMSIFSKETLAKANKVNQEVSEKIAKIKAM